jgi:uncharacterized protein YlzI (FlbEa/FlbD family)
MFEQYKPLLTEIKRSSYSTQLSEIRQQALKIIRRRYHISADLVHEVLAADSNAQPANADRDVGDSLIESASINEEQDYKTRLKSLVLDYLKPVTFSEKVIGYFESENEEGVPFTDLETDPRQVSQLKKIINAIYYVEQAFIQIEKLNLDSVFETRTNGVAIFHAMKSVNQALSLITHVDVSIQYLLKPQLNMLLPILNSLGSLSESDLSLDKLPLPDWSKLTERDSNIPLSTYSGEVVGTLINQMNPDDKDAVDYSLITHFAADLPEYISVVNKYIDKLADKTLSWDDGLNEKRLRELQEVSKKLLSSLATVQARSLLDIRNVRPYIKIMTQIVTITNELIKEINSLNGTTQRTLKLKLKQLKYDLLPQCLGLIDNMEVSLMLNPGAFSKPALKLFDQYYKLFLPYAEKVIDVDADNLGRELKYLVDDTFTLNRQASIEYRIDSAKKNLWLITHAKKSWLSFKTIMESNPTTHLAELPVETKAKLREYYQAFQPYLGSLNPELDAQLVVFLNQLPIHSDYSVKAYFKSPLIIAKNYITTKTAYFDTNSQLLAMEESLVNRFVKEENTYRFFIQLNKDVIAETTKQREAFKEVVTVLRDEKPNLSLIAIPKINRESASEIALKKSIECEKKIVSLKRAEAAFNDFWDILDALHAQDICLEAADKSNKEKLRRLYQIFRGYIVLFFEDIAETAVLMEALGDAVDVEIKNRLLLQRKQDAINSGIAFDTHICQQLNMLLPDETLFAPTLDWSMLLKMKLRLERGLSKYHREFKGASVLLKIKAKKEKGKEDLTKPLNALTSAKRRHALIKSDTASKKIAEWKKALIKHLKYFDAPFSSSLVAKESGLPFPDVESKALAVFIPEQVKAMMKVYNGLYYAEQAFIKLEGLTDRVFDYESSSSIGSISNVRVDYNYVMHMLSLIQNAKNAFDLLYYAKDDLFIQTLINDVREELVKRQTQPLNLEAELSGDSIVDELLEPDLAHNESSIEPSAQSVNFSADSDSYLSKTLALFYMLPQKLKVLDNHAISPIEQAVLKRKGKARAKAIEGVIKASSSWLLLMTHVPSIVNSLLTLKKRLDLVTKTGYEVTHHQLKEIKTDLMTNILILADGAERKFALKQGVLTTPLQTILLNFYEGLVEQLDINPDIKIKLLTEKSFIQKRVDENQKKIDAYTEQLDEIRPVLQQANVFLSDYQTFYVESARYFNHSSVLNSLRYHLIDYYSILQPLLFDQAPRFVESYLSFDAFNVEKLDDVAKAITSLLDSKRQKTSTLLLSIDLAVSKRAFLTHESRKVSVNAIQLKRKHIESRIHVLLHKKICKALRLVHFKEDYITCIHQAASKQINELILSVINQTDPMVGYESVIDNIMDNFIVSFNHQNLKSYNALEKGYSSYLDFYDFLEKDIFTQQCKDGPIIRKKDVLALFRKDLLDEKVCPNERVENAYATVTSYQFKRSMHASFSYNWKSLRWLNIWLLRLKSIFFGKKPLEDSYLADTVSFFKPTVTAFSNETLDAPLAQDEQMPSHNG